MLSYMLPAVEEKSSTTAHHQQQQRNLNLSLNLNGTNNNGHHISSSSNNIHSNLLCDADDSDENTKLLNSERDCNVMAAATTAAIIKQNFYDHVMMNNNDHNDNINNGGLNNGGDGGGGGDNGGRDGSDILINNKKDNNIMENNSFRDEINNKKLKFGTKATTKGVTLKRVSFGSSKGSMVETLVFETPTPLPEHAEREFTFSDSHNNSIGIGKPMSGNLNMNGSANLDDSGIGLQEEVERSKVRVTFFQSSKPQQVSPPETHTPFFGENNNSILIESILSETSSIDDKMAATQVVIPPTYDRQISTESGWDNPFRPGGDLSREADEIVNLIKGGKPITPTGEPNLNIGNGDVQKPMENGTVVDGATKVEAQQLQASVPHQQNGTKSPQKITNLNNNNNNNLNNNNNNTTTTIIDKPPTSATNGGATNKTHQTQISNQTLPTPQSASHVTIEDKKKKKSCCVIQ